MEELEGYRRYYEYKERCIYCDIVRQELENPKRVVATNDNFIALEPFAPRFPFETWILPRNHVMQYEDSKKEDFNQLARMLKETLSRINRALRNPPYNFIIHTSPIRDDDDMAGFHWHIEIMPKLTKVAGFEWGSGFYINPTPPEDAAKFLCEISP